MKTIDYFKETNKKMLKSLGKQYNCLFVDVDDKNYDTYERNFLYISGLRKQLKEFNILSGVEIFETRRGYHYKIFLSKSISGLFVLRILLKLHADYAFIQSFLRKGCMTLFKIRRGINNEKLIFQSPGYARNKKFWVMFG
jgi:hypothetical protein